MNKAAMVAVGVGLAWAAMPAMADDLARWTFETSIPTTAGPHVAEAGLFAASSNAIGFHLDPGVVYSNPVGNGSLESFSSNFWLAGDYYQFSAPTTGYEDIMIGWDQTRSSTGPADFLLEYSLNGSTWTALGAAYSVGTTTWSSGTPQPASAFGPIAGPASLDDQALVYFRMTSQIAGSSTGGTNRIDNVVISGTVIPAPATLALMGLAGLVVGRRRR
jgi:uncharacterized protein (TIGR03382 family)